jgi:hypothetical protein
MIPLAPDRERRHLLQFHVAPALTYRMRFVLAFLLIAAGVAVELILLETSLILALFVGGLLIFGGNLLLLSRGYDLKPRAASAFSGDWDRTTLDRFTEAAALERKIRNWDEAIVDLTCVSGAATLLFLVILPVALGFFVLASLDEGQNMAILFAVDAALLFLPHWITGLRLKWRPISLKQRIDALQTALGVIEEFGSPTVQIQPRFLMVGKAGEKIPTDARIFLRFPDGPEEFLGLQFQVAINNVQGTRYPYLYAVLVARTEFDLIHKHRAGISARLDDLTVSSDSEDDVDVIVIRQTTTKNSGYHTNAAAVRRIARAAFTNAAEVIKTPAVHTRG